MREGFLLDPDVVYLNHGGYGACPIAVFDEYQRWQREVERQPTDFFLRKHNRWFWDGEPGSSFIDEARASLAAFVGARAEDLIFMPNATSGLNAVIRSLRIRPEEEILTTKHEYGAVERTLSFIRANVVHCEPEELVGNIGVRTRAVLVSHITSPTAQRLPVEEICAAAREPVCCRSWTARTLPARSRWISRPWKPTCTRGTATKGTGRERADGLRPRDVLEALLSATRA
jgi:isopenicillin-N epimerase